MRYSTDYKQKTHARILAAAGKLFREKGYNGVGIDTVMAAVGMTPGGFYAHFASKEALFAEVIADVLKSRGEVLRFYLADKDGPEWFKALIKSYLSKLHRDAVVEGCPLPALTPDVARCGKDTKTLYEDYLQRFLSEMISKMPADTTPAKERAMALLAQLVGGLMLARAVNNDQLSDQMLYACQHAALQIISGVTPSTNIIDKRESNKADSTQTTVDEIVTTEPPGKIKTPIKTKTPTKTKATTKRTKSQVENKTKSSSRKKR